MQQNSTRSKEELHQFSKKYLPRNLLIFAKYLMVRNQMLPSYAGQQHKDAPHFHRSLKHVLKVLVKQYGRRGYKRCYIYTGKEEMKSSLFTDGMTIYAENSKESTITKKKPKNQSKTS